MNSLMAALVTGFYAQKTYVEDVFSSYTYTGNTTVQTINNGIDLAGKGGLVWIKDRTSPNSNVLQDTARGSGYSLFTDLTASQSTDASTRLSSFNSNGFTLGTHPWVNGSGDNYVSWTFRKARKFFDIVSWVGDGTLGSTIPHSLGVAPGFIIIKDINSVSNWWSQMIVSTNSFYQTQLNATAPGTLVSSATTTTGIPTDSTFQPAYISGSPGVSNASGMTYIAYLFAHDPSADGVIQCGIFSGASANVQLGWEPQFLITKQVDGANNWVAQDVTRANSLSAQSFLFLDSASVEIATANWGYPTSTGFNSGVSSAGTRIYMAIRRPNKPPTSGAQVYNVIARAGTGAAAIVNGVGFAPDLAYIHKRTLGAETASHAVFNDKLRGAGDTMLYCDLTNGESSATNGVVTGFDIMDGVRLGYSAWGNLNPNTYINHFFKRAPGFMDIVCYKGTGTAHAEMHNLKVSPELVIIKSRSSTAPWIVTLNNRVTDYDYLILNLTQQLFTTTYAANYYQSAQPTNVNITLGADAYTNASGITYVAYLFASLPGISKVFSYVGNGTSRTIPCGFSNGARFILIKRTDAVGDWYTWDTVRGIVIGNDPHLSLNTNIDEVTTDNSIDPDPSGFIVNQNTATNINVSSGTYIGLAIS